MWRHVDLFSFSTEVPLAEGLVRTACGGSDSSSCGFLADGSLAGWPNTVAQCRPMPCIYRGTEGHRIAARPGHGLITVCRYTPAPLHMHGVIRLGWKPFPFSMMVCSKRLCMGYIACRYERCVRIERLPIATPGTGPSDPLLCLGPHVKHSCSSGTGTKTHERITREGPRSPAKSSDRK